MKSMYSLAGVVVVLGVLGASCKATVEAETHGTKVGGSLELTRAEGPAGSCVTLVFLDAH